MKKSFSAKGATTRLERVVRFVVLSLLAAAMPAAVPRPLDAQPAAPARPRVGVAFGGGSARGIAHVGVIRWLEEHHVPVDLAAGTSMGGLVGGAYATGMSAEELRLLIDSTDWDVLFGSNPFPFKNVRRKDDARDFPARLEFGLKHGLVPPTSLNTGQQVDFLLTRIAAAYYDLERFDDLPTPFRTVAVDLRTAERVVIDRGSLALAMRATMSLPGIFPPVEIGKRVLVDGGALDNVPADVVRDMGADFVIAVDVGYSEVSTVDYSMFRLMGQTVDSMMRANTRRALESADLMIAVDVAGFGSLDWRRSIELMDRGYQAAEKRRAELLPHALDEAQWQAWVEARQQRRRRTLPVPGSLSIAGAAPGDARLVRKTLVRHVGRPLDIPEIENDVLTLSGLDRYQAVVWQIAGPPGKEGLLVRAREKPYAPPFMMLGINLENTTSNDFRVQLAGRYLAFDTVGSGSELRIGAAIGSDPAADFSLYRPILGSRLFVRPFGAAYRRTIDLVDDDVVVAQYNERRAFLGGEVGVSLSRESEVAGGVRFGRIDADVRAGDPGLPEVGGTESLLQLGYVYDGQDSPVVPSRGLRTRVDLVHTIGFPRIPDIERTNEGVTQLEGGVSQFWTWRRRHRLFAVAQAGTSFDGHPISQFSLGYPFRLDAFRIGERRGDHYVVVTVGAARQIARLPDFMGGPVFAAAWLENGSAFDSGENADINSHAALGLVMDTLVGPVLAGTSFGLDGGFRVFFGIGRVVR